MLGNADALVTLVVFIDFECPFCAAAHELLAELRTQYSPEELRIVYKHNPLPSHATAPAAARAAQAIHDLAGANAFQRYSDTLFQHQAELDESRFASWATAVGVSGERFSTAYASERVDAEVKNDVALAVRLGEAATPSFRINGIELVGARPLPVFTQVIDMEIEEAQTLVKSGTARREVYALLVSKNFKRTLD
jgi:protein-disulfide isomerase